VRFGQQDQTTPSRVHPGFALWRAAHETQNALFRFPFSAGRLGVLRNLHAKPDEDDHPGGGHDRSRADYKKRPKWTTPSRTVLRRHNTMFSPVHS